MNEFFQAVQAGDLAAVKRFIAADPSLLKAKDERGLDAFTVARYSRQNDVAAFLLESGVELDIFSASMAGAHRARLPTARRRRDAGLRL